MDENSVLVLNFMLTVKQLTVLRLNPRWEPSALEAYAGICMGRCLVRGIPTVTEIKAVQYLGS